MQLAAANRIASVATSNLIESTPHSFIRGLKPSFSANPSHRSLPFLLQDWLHGLRTVYRYFWAYLFFYLFSCFSTFYLLASFGRIKLTHVSFWARVETASRIESLFRLVESPVTRAFQFAIRIDSLCESIRFVKKSAFRFTSVVQFFLLIYCIVSAEKIHHNARNWKLYCVEHPQKQLRNAYHKNYS